MKKVIVSAFFLMILHIPLFAQTVKYDIINIQSSYTDSTKIDFDIAISKQDTPTYYLTQANIYVSMNDTAVSGSSFKLVSGYSGYIFGSTSYTDGYEITAEALDTTDISTKFSTSEYPVIFCHVHLSLSACGVYPNITLDKSSMDGETECDYIEHHDVEVFDYWEITAYDSLGNPTDSEAIYSPETVYDTLRGATPSIDVSGSYNRITCDPVITDNSYPTIAAGVNDVLAIHGYNFGNDDTTVCRVYFLDANQGNAIKYYAVDDTDIVNWNDSEIDVRVPSVIFRSSIYPVPGTGIIKVQNANFELAASTPKVNIQYAVINWHTLDSQTHIIKERFDMSGPNPYNGYTVHIESDYAINHPAIVPCIKGVLREWSCATNVNWRLGNDTLLTSTQDADTANVCYIHFGRAPSNTKILASTKAHFKLCPLKNHYTEIGFDILVDTFSHKWFYDATGDSSQPFGYFDFYSAILHELGHAHTLNHVIDSNSIMYAYSDSAATAPLYRKIYLNNYAGDIIGGDTAMKFAKYDDPGTGCFPNMEALSVIYCNIFPSPLHVTGITPSCTCPQSHTIKLLPTIVGGVPYYTYKWKALANNNAHLNNLTDSNPTVSYFSGSPHIIAWQVKVLDNSVQQKKDSAFIYDTIPSDSTKAAAYAMHDGPRDVFHEPDIEQSHWPWTGINPYSSTDIWNRWNKDGSTVYQEPQFKGGDTPNYIYVRVWNNGCTRQDTTNADSCSYLHVYWTFAALTERWRCDWIGKTKLGAFTDGKEITPHGGLKLGGLAPGKDTVIAISWLPPAPVEIPTIESAQLCVLARVIKPGVVDSGLNPKYIEEYERDSLGPDTPTSGFYKVVNKGSTYDNVVNHYNIATRNMKVFKLSKYVILMVSPIIMSNGSINGFMDWSFSSLPNVSDSGFNHIGTIKMVVGPVLYNRWLYDCGTYSAGITPLPGEYAFQVTDPTNAWVYGLPLTYSDTPLIYVKFQLTSTDIDTILPSRYAYNLSQYLEIGAGRVITGGNNYEADVNIFGSPNFPVDTVISDYYGYSTPYSIACTLIDSSTTMCYGSSLAISAYSLPCINHYSWVFLNSGGTVINTATTYPPDSMHYTFTPASVGKITLYIKAVSSLGTVIDSIKRYICVKPLPAANAGSNITICSGASVSIGAGAVSGDTYCWKSSPTGYTSLVSNPTVSPTTTTSYTLTEKITATGCKNSNNVVITVNPLPDANTGPNSPVCVNSNIQIGATAVSGNTYSWSSDYPGFTDPGISNPTITPTITGTYTYTLTETTPASCQNSNTVTITVNPLPEAIAGSNSVICSGASVPVGASLVSGDTYCWKSTPTGYSSTVANPSVSPTITTVYTLTEKVTATGCKNSNDITISVNPVPIANAGSNQTVCAGTLTAIGGAPVFGDTYCWKSNYPGFTNPATANPSITPTISGTYYYSLTEKITATGCQHTDTAIITVNPLPEANAGSNATICSGTSIPIGASAVSGNTYSWTSDYPDFVNPGTANPTITLTSSGTYGFTLTETTTAGCYNSHEIWVIVNPLPNALTGGDQSVYTGATVVVGVSPVGGSAYSWYSDYPSFSNPGTSSYSFVPTVTGTYTFALTETISETGCDSSNSMVLTVSDEPPTFVLNPANLHSGPVAPYLKCYPNPSNGTFTVEYNGLTTGTIHLNVFDMMGKAITSLELPQNENNQTNLFSFDASDYNIPAGMYYIMLQNDKTQLNDKILIVKEY